ncbi:MAG: NFACT RNA binding domain-containing protein [Firmicutes bacterium]|nr:NFACT RNA binding domain-containing protein [Bacillota bacterium]
MAFDGITTCAMVRELNEKIYMGKIEKVYQPEADELVFNIHTKTGNCKLFASTGSAHARMHFIEENPVNPPAPLAFCMLLRKHLQGGRIIAIEQKGSERIIEISIETLNELGFTVSKKLIFEIMGKHSNIILTDISTGKIIDSIKRVSFDVNRVRQILPGMIYQYPPEQDKIPFGEITGEQLDSLPADGKTILRSVGGISPAFAEELAEHVSSRSEYFFGVKDGILDGTSGNAFVYLDEKEAPVDFYPVPLKCLKESCKTLEFSSLSAAMEFYFNKKESSNKGRQKSHDLIRSVNTALDKMYLKKKRLSEDLLKAENSEDLRLYGELLTANIHLIKPGMKSVDVVNYYDGSTVTIPLDVKQSPAKNAQHYFKKYGKAKTAVKEKQIQLEENDGEIKYLESVLAFLENTDDVDEIESIRNELVETGYVRRRKQQGGFKEKKYKPAPHRYTLSNGMTVLVGKNNKENDYLTFNTAGNRDLWLHTKDIPGSHVIVQSSGQDLDEKAIFEAAAIAAYHSKARTSENVPVDYVPVKYVKKPAGAKPGMVIFTNNRTVWVNPALPNQSNSTDTK